MHLAININIAKLSQQKAEIINCSTSANNLANFANSEQIFQFLPRSNIQNPFYLLLDKSNKRGIRTVFIKLIS